MLRASVAQMRAFERSYFVNWLGGEGDAVLIPLAFPNAARSQKDKLKRSHLGDRRSRYFPRSQNTM